MSTPQRPLGSGFTAHSTTLDVIRGIDLTGKEVMRGLGSRPRERWRQLGLA
jgi:hypothetical protein